MKLRYFQFIVSIGFIFFFNSMIYAEPYSYSGELIGISISNPDISKPGVISGNANISIKTKDGTGSIRCDVKMNMVRKHNSRDFENSPNRIESTSDCNENLVIGNKSFTIKKLEITGRNVFEKTNEISIRAFGKALVDLGNTKISMLTDEWFFIIWNKNICAEISSGNSKYSLQVGPISYPNGKFHIRKGQVEVSNSSMLKDSISRVTWDQSQKDNCNIFSIASGYEDQAAKFGIK